MFFNLIFPLFIFLNFTQVAQALEVPYLMGRVNDYAHVLNDIDSSRIENFLALHEKKTGQQIVLLTIDTLANEVIEQYSIKVVDKWKIGKKGKDDGVLLLVAVKDRALRIEVGYGLEGELTDAITSRIIRNVIVPKFKEGQMPEGIERGLETIIGVLGGNTEVVPQSGDDNYNRGFLSRGSTTFRLLVWLFFIIIFGFGRRRRRSSLWWLGAGGSSSGWGGGSSRSSWGGGFSGGGGGFGGGGSSGKW